MPVGSLQPNEVLSYLRGESSPRYIRRVYVFEELTQFDSDPDDTSIKGICQTATGTKLPDDGEPLLGLPMLEMRVARYSERRGEATIVVEWGDRFYSSGAAPDVKREGMVYTPPRQILQPFGIAFTGVGPAPLMEIRNRPLYRNVHRIGVSRLMDEAQANTLYQTSIAANDKARMGWRGVDRIIVGGNVRPVGQTQAYLTVFLDYYSSIAEVPEGTLYVSGETKQLRIEALGINEEYLQPVLGEGTGVRPANEEYPVQVDPFPWLIS